MGDLVVATVPLAAVLARPQAADAAKISTIVQPTRTSKCAAARITRKASRPKMSSIVTTAAHVFSNISFFSKTLSTGSTRTKAPGAALKDLTVDVLLSP